MALINRITRLFRADMHAVLDRLEEPESQLREAIREMESVLQADRISIGLMQQELEAIESRLSKLQTQQDPMQEELQLCMDAGEEVLARGIIRRQLQGQRMQEGLQQRAQQLSTALQQRQQEQEENGQRLQGMQQKLELLGKSCGRDESTIDTLISPVVAEDEVEIAYLRELQKRQPS